MLVSTYQQLPNSYEHPEYSYFDRISTKFTIQSDFWIKRASQQRNSHFLLLPTVAAAQEAQHTQSQVFPIPALPILIYFTAGRGVNWYQISLFILHTRSALKETCKGIKNEAYCCWALIKKPYKAQHPAVTCYRSRGTPELCTPRPALWHRDAAALKQWWAKHARGNIPWVSI